MCCAKGKAKSKTCDCKACEKEGGVKVCGSHFNQLFPAGFATESPFLFICLFNLVAEKLMLLL